MAAALALEEAEVMVLSVTVDQGLMGKALRKEAKTCHQAIKALGQEAVLALQVIRLITVCHSVFFRVLVLGFF